ncbi:dual specificity protein phosphatase family protein [Denitrificimonas caeni]|uniref:dual specificity protein phosphatase family protein n=1 Tax=Denitrificimonas caeni TaxID=521720 RepID=UPI0003B5E7BE|nr:dual specificity protein phosphatase family protein [Denitrificimonas caeni]
MKRYVYIAAGLILGVLATVLWQKYTFTAAPKLAVTTVKLKSRPASWAQPVDPDFVLYKMSDSLYRSALPRVQDVEWLQQNKIQTVINFYQKPDSLWLRDTGIEQIQIPLRTDRIDDADVLRVLRSIASAEQKGKVLMHCKHGQNRTGLIAAMYRIVFEDWSKADAMAEMEQGFGGEARMADATRYLENVDVETIKQALASGACSTQTLAWCQVAQWVEKHATDMFNGSAKHSSRWVEQRERVLTPAGI